MNLHQPITIWMLLQLPLLVLARSANAQSSDGPSREDYLRIADQIESSLRHDDLEKFFPAAVDPRGGFFECFAEDWTHNPDDSTRSIVYQSRLTWLAAQAAMRYPAQANSYLSFARHGAQFLADKQWDKSNGGFWWSVDLAGHPQRADDKHIYGTAFAIYALAAAYQATHDQADLDLARQAFRWMETHAHDEANGGYFEQLRGDGSHIDASSASAPDVLGAGPGMKSMNANIHLLEAFTALLNVWPDPLLRKRTEEVYQIILTKIYSPPGYLRLFFQPDWTPAGGVHSIDRDSYGHDIETAYLLIEAAAALGKPDDKDCWRIARTIVDHCLAVAYDPTSGSLNNEGTVDGQGEVDRSRVWWGQAESLNSLLMMHARFGNQDSRYWKAFAKEWDFIRKFQIDHKYGGWFNTLDPDNTPVPYKLDKTDAWTEGYHQGRAMMNVIDRLRKLAQPKT